MRALPFIVCFAACGATVWSRWCLLDSSVFVEPKRNLSLVSSPSDNLTCEISSHRELVERRDRAQREIASIATLRKDLEGEPIPWPDLLDERLQPNAIERVVKSAINSVPEEMRLVDLHCEEYPCISVVEQVESHRGPETTNRGARALRDALQADPNYTGLPMQGLIWKISNPDGSQRHRMAFAVLPREPTLEEVVRIRMRVTELSRIDAAAEGRP